MPSFLRRHRPARLPPTTPSTPSICPVPLTLTTAEIHHVLTRRLRNDYLPDDPHTLFAEHITTLTTLATSFLAKLYILDRKPLTDLATTHPRLTIFLRILTLSQLRPFRLLTLPLVRVFRPLSWLLAPFAAMSLPLAAHLIVKAVVRHLTPAPPPRPKFVDAIVQTAADVRDTISDTVHRARDAVETDLHHYFDQPPPQLPALSDLIPQPFAAVVASHQSQSASVETSPSPTTSLSRQGTYTRNPVPSFRSAPAPPGLSALAGAASSSVQGTPRPQNGLASELSSDGASDTPEDKPLWYKRPST